MSVQYDACCLAVFLLPYFNSLPRSLFGKLAVWRTRKTVRKPLNNAVWQNNWLSELAKWLNVKTVALLWSANKPYNWGKGCSDEATSPHTDKNYMIGTSRTLKSKQHLPVVMHKSTKMNTFTLYVSGFFRMSNRWGKRLGSDMILGL